MEGTMKKIIPGLIAATVLLSVTAHAAEPPSLRERLLKAGPFSSVYSIDDRSTLVTANSAEAALKGLGKACSELGSGLATKEGVRCPGVFEAKKSEATDEAVAYIVVAEADQPFLYRGPAARSLDEVSELPAGKVEGRLSSMDVYQYVSALCRKGNGSPSMVVSKRYGKRVRFTEVDHSGALSYILSSGDSKDPWFFACEGGEARFFVEKGYGFSSEGRPAFYYHPRRPIEWVDFVRLAGKEKVARLDPR